MSKHLILNRMLGVATLAMMFGAASVHAQSTSGTSPSSSGMSSQSQSGSSDTKSSASSGASGTAGSSASSAASGSLSSGDQKMMKDLAQANMAEIEAGKLAQQKSNDEQVKNFAQKMVDDHTKAGEQLQQLAQAKGVTLPTQTDAKHKAEIKKLSALSGDKFDKAYMTRGGVQDHRQAHALLGRIEKNAKDADLKNLASNLMPTINDHLKLATDMRSEQASATGSSGNKSQSRSGGGKSMSSSATQSSGGGTDSNAPSVKPAERPTAGSAGGSK